MSRDWTPQELRLIDKQMSLKGESFRNANFVFHDIATGKEIPLKSEREREIGKKFPELSFLYEEWFEVYEALGNAVVKEQLFEELEDTLEIIIAEENGEKLDKNCDANIKKAIYKWYCGELDPSFYYRERNDKMFADFIRNLYSDRVLNEKIGSKK